LWTYSPTAEAGNGFLSMKAKELGDEQEIDTSKIEMPKNEIMAHFGKIPEIRPSVFAIPNNGR